MHDYHEQLPGFSPNQLLHDGCEECETRAAGPSHGIANLDRTNFVLAWHRATEWNRSGLPDLANAERPMLNAIWAIQLQLERYGTPIGSLPHGSLT